MSEKMKRISDLELGRERHMSAAACRSPGAGPEDWKISSSALEKIFWWCCIRNSNPDF